MPISMVPAYFCPAIITRRNLRMITDITEQARQKLMTAITNLIADGYSNEQIKRILSGDNILPGWADQERTTLTVHLLRQPEELFPEPAERAAREQLKQTKVKD
jgi:uncharacterized membrane-anchored protein